MIFTLQIFPGPEQRENGRLVTRIESISRFSAGTIVSMSGANETFQIANYKIVLVGYSRYKVISNIKLLVRVLYEAMHLKIKGNFDLVVCYDPLKIGLYGLITKIIYRTKLLVEVNSEFDSADLYNFRPGLMGHIKKLAYPNVKRFVLYWANGVKGLFHGQLDGVNLRTKTKVDYFFDHTPIKTNAYEANEQNIVLTLGFPAIIKGMDLLIRAFQELPEENNDWTLEIYGWFDDYDTKQLHILANGCDRIKINKPLEFSQVPAKIDDCNLFVLASRTEGVPRVLLESMARGRARIGSRVGGVPSIIEHGVDGILFDKENVKQLTTALNNMMNSEERRKEMASNGLARFEREFTLEKYSYRIKLLYERILND